MCSEQSGALRLVKIEKGLHCGPAPEVAEYRSDGAICVRLVGQAVVRKTPDGPRPGFAKPIPRSSAAFRRIPAVFIASLR